MIVTGIVISAPLALTRAPRPSARAVRFTTRRCLFSCEPDIGRARGDGTSARASRLRQDKRGEFRKRCRVQRRSKAPPLLMAPILERQALRYVWGVCWMPSAAQPGFEVALEHMAARRKGCGAPASGARAGGRGESCPFCPVFGVWSRWGWLCPEQRQGGWGQPSITPRASLVWPGVPLAAEPAALHRPVTKPCCPLDSRSYLVDAHAWQNLRIPSTTGCRARLWFPSDARPALPRKLISSGACRSCCWKEHGRDRRDPRVDGHLASRRNRIGGPGRRGQVWPGELMGTDESCLAGRFSRTWTRSTVAPRSKRA
jgi:hypothetical protein